MRTGGIPPLPGRNLLFCRKRKFLRCRHWTEATILASRTGWCTPTGPTRTATITRRTRAPSSASSTPLTRVFRRKLRRAPSCVCSATDTRYPARTPPRRRRPRTGRGPSRATTSSSPTSTVRRCVIADGWRSCERSGWPGSRSSRKRNGTGRSGWRAPQGGDIRIEKIRWRSRRRSWLSWMATCHRPVRPVMLCHPPTSDWSSYWNSFFRFYAELFKSFPRFWVKGFTWIFRFFTSIFHVHFSRPFFTSIFHVHFSRPFFTSIFHVVVFEKGNSFDMIWFWFLFQFFLKKKPPPYFPK